MVDIIGILPRQTAWYNDKAKRLKEKSREIQWNYPYGRQRLLLSRMDAINKIAQVTRFLTTASFGYLPSDSQILKEVIKKQEAIENALNDLAEATLKKFPGGSVYPTAGYTCQDNFIGTKEKSI